MIPTASRFFARATRFFCGILILSLSLGLPDIWGQEEESLSRGAVILAEKTDPVSFLDENNQSLGKAFSLSGRQPVT